ncbi:ectonucleoside triphosphate diphosphohydrolase 2 isoform X6 [Balaenoptera musculus]|uniref:Ectonucleoside triphosphate diphosphohydrolase 2 isoform X6 n=1 Tax=Balaenoptera musculus TaxID=9771 RepID=A0A8B8XY68_BALMU|nr:ectonucleoside triphosphate diphosphohydrolase 2 isoform X6 [Balaenoptera musculus]
MAGKALSLLPPLLLAAAGLAGLLLLCVPTRDIREPPALKYGIVLDAGSSHTSMFIYKWPADKENDTGIVGQHSSCDVRGGGISSYADSPSRAGQSLVECLNQALRDVPKERHAGTPLYLGATAGMRLLNTAGWASGSGQRRGRWGPWTWGAPPHRSPSRRPAQLRIRPVRSSCGSTASTTASTPTASSAMAVTRSSGGCWPVHSRPTASTPAGRRATPLTCCSRMCMSRRALQPSGPRPSTEAPRCSFNGIFQPPLAGKFIAFSAFFYTVDFLRTVMGLPVATLQQLEAAVVTICNQTWSERPPGGRWPYSLPPAFQLQARAPGERARLPDYCAGATFVQQLLRRGYGFDERAFGGVTFQKKAGDTAVGWALGYMLNLTNLIPADPPGLRKGTDFSSWVVLLLLFAAMPLAAFVLLLHRARSAKSPSAI